MVRILLGLITAAALGSIFAVVGVAPASVAAPLPTVPEPSPSIVGVGTVGAAVEDQLRSELDGTGWAKSTSAGGGWEYTTYGLAGGASLTLSARDSSGVQPRFGAGGSGGEFYVQLNHDDQVAIKNGFTAALVIFVCAAGPVTCAIATVVGAFVGTYIGAHGFCSGNRQMRFYYGLDGSVGRVTCVAA